MNCRRPALLLALALAVSGAADSAIAATGGLFVRASAGWVRWWSAAAAPTAWSGADRTLTSAITWSRYGEGLELGLADLSAPGEARYTRLVVVRLDPKAHHLKLETALTADFVLPDWRVSRAPPSAALAVNAGQFSGIVPWGWLVIGGREIRPPGRGPLSSAVVIDAQGTVRLVPSHEITAVRKQGGVTYAFQSYPVLLEDGGRVPAALRDASLGVDLTHRDARLGLGVLGDGRLLLAMTRFRGLGDAADFVPVGLTNPEMAAVMGALGCRSAVALDGGISAQLLVRNPDGRTRAWRGLRAVPLGLIAEPRASS